MRGVGRRRLFREVWRLSPISKLVNKKNAMERHSAFLAQRRPNSGPATCHSCESSSFSCDVICPHSSPLAFAARLRKVTS